MRPRDSCRSQASRLQAALPNSLLIVIALFTLLGAGDEAARFQDLGHHTDVRLRLQPVLLECNHVGCQYSDRMRNELVAALDRGDNDDLTLQSFVQKYGPTVIAAPSTTGFNRVAWIMPYLRAAGGNGRGSSGSCAPGASVPRPAIADVLPPLHGPELERSREQARKDTDL